MKKIFFLIIPLTGLFLSSCNCDCNDKNSTVDSTDVVQMKHPNTQTFYKTEKPDDAVIFADSIIYDVVIQNSQYGNDWTNDCSYWTSAEAVDVDAIINMIFHAIYKERLVPYDLFSNEPMSIDEVKALEKKYERNIMAKIEFKEEWYFNENTLEMSKLIKELSFGYENVDKDGIVLNYYPAFKIYLNNPEKNQIAK